MHKSFLSSVAIFLFGLGFADLNIGTTASAAGHLQLLACLRDGGGLGWMRSFGPGWVTGRIGWNGDADGVGRLVAQAAEAVVLSQLSRRML